MSRSRAQRLAELRDEVARAAGYSAFADMSGTDRQRAEQVSLLRLQYEVAAARLVNGGELATNELIQLSQAITAALPAAKAKPIEIVFVDSDGNGNPGVGGEEQRLRRENAELRAQLAEARTQHALPALRLLRCPKRHLRATLFPCRRAAAATRRIGLG